MSSRKAYQALAAVLWSLTGLSHAQQPKDPALAYAYPAGGKQGTVVEVTVGGQQLENVTGGMLSGGDVQVAVTGYSRPLNSKRFNEFRETIAEYRKEMMGAMSASAGKRVNPDDLAAILQEDGATEEEVRLFRIMQTQKNDPKRQDNKQLAETVSLRVEISPDAAKGPRTLRLLGKNGISNPLSFFIGGFPEERQPGTTEPALPAPAQISFPVVLNGQIAPGRSVRYRFHASQGEQLVFSVQARDLIPYLADAVPGWFQSVLTIFDSRGREVASAQSARFSADPVLLFDVKKSGDYEVDIRDALHRGREDFVYRITAGPIPFVTGIFPLGGPTGSSTSVEVSGWNLSRGLTARVPAGEGIGGVTQLANGFATMDVAFAHDTNPEAFASEPDNDPSHAPPISIPTTINGRIEVPGDVDTFAVKFQKGDPVVVEVLARRLNSPVDSFLRITDFSGRQLAYSDDLEDVGQGLLTHHADSKLRFDPPSSGLFYVQVGDSQRQGGKEFSYRLRIGRPEPDFSLRVVPSGITGSPGSSVPVTIYAVRKDGFSGDIKLSASPAKFQLSGGCLPGGSDSVPVTLTFPDSPIAVPEPVEISGTAEISGSQVTRTAVPADDMLQAFFYHHLVPAPALLAYSPSDRSKKPLLVRPGTARISPTSAGCATVILPKTFQKEGLKAELKKFPEGISVESVLPSRDGVDISFRADPKQLKPGARGNLIVELSALKVDPKADKSQGEKRWSMGFLPAIPYEIAGK